MHDYIIFMSLKFRSKNTNKSYAKEKIYILKPLKEKELGL